MSKYYVEGLENLVADHKRLDQENKELRQRIVELEAEVTHYKQWLKERTSELKAEVRRVNAL